jgi:ABC-type polysaccharide/polyol phosphate export permease
MVRRAPGLDANGRCDGMTGQTLRSGPSPGGAADAAAAVPSYDSAQGESPILREARDLFRYRDLLGLMVVNIAKSRYKRSVLGVLWTLMNPVLNTIVLTVAFANIFRSSLPNYALYVLSGMVCWNLFTTTTVYAMNSLIWGGAILGRIYIPRTIFAAAAVGNGLTSFGFALVPLVGIMVITRHPWTLALTSLPLAVLLLTAFVFGVSLLVSSIAVLYTDFVEFYQVMVQALFFLTPIMYPEEILPAWALPLMRLNPMYSLVEMFRLPVYYGRFPDVATTVSATVTSAAFLLVGWVAFTRRADELPYRI